MKYLLLILTLFLGACSTGKLSGHPLKYSPEMLDSTKDQIITDQGSSNTLQAFHSCSTLNNLL